MKSPWLVVLAGSVMLSSFAYADVTYQETTQITGGSLLGMMKMAGVFSSQARQANVPITSKVMLRGGRMVRVNPHQTEIIDLDQQQITTIDNDKRTYSVLTFQQMRDQMQKMTTQAKSTSKPNSEAAQMAFSAHVSSNGSNRQIDGLNATESLLSVTMTSTAADANKAGMAATSEIWSVPDAPGLAEIRAFNLRMASELAVQSEASAMSSLLASQPGGAEALTELKKETAKMSGFPVLQVTRMGLTADGQPLPAPTAAPLPKSQNEDPTASAVAQEAATGTATQTADSQMARLGTFGRALSGSTMGSLMHHTSKTATPAPAPAAASPDAATAGVLLETQTETSGFSTAPIDPASLEVPAGYKALASPLEHK